MVTVKLNNGNYLFVQFGCDNEVLEGCDSYVDFTIYDKDFHDIDGGQMDYNSETTCYNSIIDTIPDVLRYQYDDDVDVSFEEVADYNIVEDDIHQ